MKKFAPSAVIALSGLSLSFLPSPALAQIFRSNLPPEVRITSPPNHAVFYAPVDIPIFAFAREFGVLLPTNHMVTNVEFFAGTIDLGAGHRLRFGGLPYGPPTLGYLDEYSVVWTNPPVGAYALTAVAMDTQGKLATSAPVCISVILSVTGTNRPDVVSIAAIDPLAIEGTNCWVWRGLTNGVPSWTNWAFPVWRLFTNCGPKSATFAVRRFGDASTNLTVAYDIGGTASNGVDYVALPGTVTIPTGAAYGLISIVPIDDGLPDTNKTVVLTLAPATNLPPDYLLGFPRRAAALILDGNQLCPPTGMVPISCFHLNAAGPDGAWFSVRYTTDFVNWTGLCTNQVVNGSIDFIDPDAANDPNRFYQAVPQGGPPQ